MTRCAYRDKPYPLPAGLTIESARMHPTYKYRLEPGAQCELELEHDGPHRNGTMVWHDPPLILVGGKPVPPLTEREEQLLARIGVGDSTRPLAVERLGTGRPNGTSSGVTAPSEAPSPAAPLLTPFALGETAFRGPDDPFPEGF